MHDTIHSHGLEKATIEKVRESLLGLNVGQLDRTHGSMFFLKLGQLSDVEGSRKAHKRGEWELLVEAADWVLALPAGGYITSGDGTRDIDHCFASVKNTPIDAVTIAPNGHLRLSTASGHILMTRQADSEFDGLSRWTLYHADIWCLVCRFDGSFDAGDPRKIC